MKPFWYFEHYYNDSDTFPILGISLFDSGGESGVVICIVGLSIAFGFKQQ